MSGDAILNPPAATQSAAGAGKGSSSGGLSAQEREQLLKLEKKDGISSNIMVSNDGAKTRQFDKMLRHLQAVGAQANHAMADMVKHRGQEQTAKAAVKKIQESEEAQESSSDSALLTITSVCSHALSHPPPSPLSALQSLSLALRAIASGRRRLIGGAFRASRGSACEALLARPVQGERGLLAGRG